VSRIHRFSAYGFKEDFPLGELSGDWSMGSIGTDPKDYRIKAVGLDSVAYAFNFGALTFWNAGQAERIEEIGNLRMLFHAALAEKVVTEDFLVVEDPSERPRVEFSRLVLDKLTPERAQVVAMTLAQSAAMEYYENLAQEILTKVSAMAERLQAKGRVNARPKKFYRIIGEAITMRKDVVGVLHLLDRPDTIWEDKTMDALYGDLRAVFDLPERYQALSCKLQMIQETLELLVDIARDQRLFAAEMAIIVLIMVEVVISLAPKFLPYIKF
jgi:required for meiotic nuclear division protein 1